jgi:hypothetical protein
MREVMKSLAVTVFVFAFSVGSAMAGPITFSDETNSAGVFGRKRGIGPAFGDYDNDGDMDLYLSKSFQGPVFLKRNNRLWENNGSGKFTNVARVKGVENLNGTSTGLGRGVSFGDCDNDGDLDLLVGNMDSGMADTPVPLTTLYINGGATADPPYSFTTETCTRGLHRRNEPCTDNIRGGLKATSGGIAWGDYNNDGCLDIFWRTADWAVDNVLFKNLKKGAVCTCTFEDVTEQAGVTFLTTPPLVAKVNCQGNGNWVDYDNDEDLDLLVPNEGDKNILFKNNGDGTFTDVTTIKGLEGNAFINIGNAQGACWGDIDNDGDLDAYIPNADQANRLIRNDLVENGGAAGFTDITLASGTGDFGGVRGCTMGDYDNDGYLDIYVNNGGPSDVLFNDTRPDIDPFLTQFYVADTPANNVLFRNNGDGTFSDVTKGSGAEVYGEGRGVATGDYDDDGRLDLYVTNLHTEGDKPLEQEGVLLRNTTTGGNNWITVELHGTLSNKSGIGARVKCVSRSFTQMREIASATGYNSADDPRAHFGLGKDTKVTSIEVTWPKPHRSVQTLEKVGVNKIFTCTEGAGCVEK